MKIDPYKHKEKYLRWKFGQQGHVQDITRANADLIRLFIFDLEVGLNVSRTSKRGPRSYVRLNTLRDRLSNLARKLTERFSLDLITDVTEEQIHTLFHEMRSGTIAKKNGKNYMSVGDFVKDFKTFWHWHMEIQRKKGLTVPDITSYLSAHKDKPKWVYLDEEQFKQMRDQAKYEYRVLMTFLLDSGVRSPTELVNLLVSDFSDDFTTVHVRDAVSKTFGRRIKLMLSTDLVRDFVRKKKLAPTDQVFKISPTVANRYFKRLAQRVFGNGKSLAGEYYNRISLYDFRHISACYWLPRYKSESALKYRFGWKQTERIHYYTELLGMRDNITEDDLLLDVEKTEIERRLAQSERDKQTLQEQLIAMQKQMERISKVTERLMLQAA